MMHFIANVAYTGADINKVIWIGGLRDPGSNRAQNNERSTNRLLIAEISLNFSIVAS